MNRSGNQPCQGAPASFYPSGNARCQTCVTSRLCLPMSLGPEETESIAKILQKSRPLQKGEWLFRAGDGFQSIYAVRSGCLKSYAVAPDGTEQLVAFHMPGEIIGLDAIHADHHPSFSQAVETATVCGLPFNELEELAGRLPRLRNQLFRLMSQEVHSDQWFMMLLAKKNADQRLAAFLLNISERFERRGLSGIRFRLPMMRVDIANYLGLTIETVSRLFKRLQQQGLVEVKEKEVHLPDRASLKELAGI